MGSVERVERVEKRELGNVAAMREALVKVKELFDGRLMFQPAIRAAHEAVNAALHAKPRNCDMPLVVDGPADNNADKAWIVFKQHNPDAYFDVPGLLRCIDWLFAPATEGK